MSESSQDGVRSWTESMSARERIRAVAETLREPRSVNWISNQADTAWSTTNEELHALVEQGRVRRVGVGDTTLYEPDYTRLLFDEMTELSFANDCEQAGHDSSRVVSHPALQSLDGLHVVRDPVENHRRIP